MNDFRSGPEFAALMVSLRRIEDVNRVAFEAAQTSERSAPDRQDRRSLERENKLLGRQLRSALICSAYSIAEAVILGFAPKSKEKYEVLKSKVQVAYCLGDEKPSALHLEQYQLQHVLGVCRGEKWDKDWLELHELRVMRNFLLHSGGIGEENKLLKKIGRKKEFSAWIEPMFEGSNAPIYVLVVGEMEFRQWLQRLQSFLHDIGAELSKLGAKTEK